MPEDERQTNETLEESTDTVALTVRVRRSTLSRLRAEAERRRERNQKRPEIGEVIDALAQKLPDSRRTAKSIAFNAPVWMEKKMDDRANSLGMTISEYIRYLFLDFWDGSEIGILSQEIPESQSPTKFLSFSTDSYVERLANEGARKMRLSRSSLIRCLIQADLNKGGNAVIKVKPTPMKNPRTGRHD
jgi:hypothetical protein